MHNGQVGGYGKLRRRIDMMIPDTLYDSRKGATDSEALFLMALAEGLEDDPQGAFERAVGWLETLSRTDGTAPHMRLTAALSDGNRLFAIRYSSDAEVPTLYHSLACNRGGRAVVSEPLEVESEGWEAIPPGSWAEIRADGVSIRRFRPVGVTLAA
jgi:glutamine amidotransferase